MNEEVVEGLSDTIGLFHVLIRQYFCMCAVVPGSERPNHPPAKPFHAGLGVVGRDCEHMRDIPQCVLIKSTVNLKE